MNPTALFLNTLGQALANQSLYAPGHPMRATARARVHGALTQVLRNCGGVRISFLDGNIIVGTRLLADMRGWEWATRLAAAGMQRLEIDAVPVPTFADVDALVNELHQRLAPNADPSATVSIRGFRFGPLGVEIPDEFDGVVGDLLEAISQMPMTEEASAVRWIHDHVAEGREMPMAEVEAVVHSLAMAIHREQHIVLPLLDIKSHDEYTTTHSCNVAMLAMGLADQLGLSPADARTIGSAALLHDIGKVKVPTEILVKAGELTPAEMAIMRTYPVEGARILGSRARGHALAATVAYEHHIWENGAGGYPLLKWPRRCHFASRLVHVCDLYDSLSTRRPYREAWPQARVIAFLKERSGIEVDGELVDAFVAMLARSAESRSVPEDVEAATSGWSGEMAANARIALERAAAKPEGSPRAEAA
jgi:putative nucleotidyltransferase with HDIG domain